MVKLRVPAESGTMQVTETAAHEHEPVRPTTDNAPYRSTSKTAELAAVDKERDEEMTEFLDTVLLSKRADKRYVKEHYGRVSDGKTASGAYSNDRDVDLHTKAKLSTMEITWEGD